MNTYEPDGLTGIAWRKSSFSAGNGGCVEVGWRKSSFSASNGNCIEVGWRKSSFSASNSDCVEVAPTVAGIAVRDSKQNDGPQLAFPVTDWRSFLGDLA
ncbi:DUF397 domain-containing protein [Actinokineospora sp.]|uniref:DUF397 domain-containing protein n=1 Tax=Actinokineospora sp. TaxID=1872133 RepID=UPI004037E31F